MATKKKRAAGPVRSETEEKPVAAPSAVQAPIAPVQATASNPQSDVRGLECRQCGSKHFRVIYTRSAWGGRILRRRECRHCGRRMTTWEKTSG